MAKKDFTTIKTNPVYSAIAEMTADTQPETVEAEEVTAEPTETPTAEKKAYKARRTYTEAEMAEALENLQTSGKKGVKLPRINLAFSPANYEFCKIMARVRGQNLTEFVNDIIREARENHAELYEQAIKFRNSL